MTGMANCENHNLVVLSFVGQATGEQVFLQNQQKCHEGHPLETQTPC